MGAWEIVMNDKNFKPYKLPFQFTPEQVESVADIKTEKWIDDIHDAITPKIPTKLIEQRTDNQILAELQKVNRHNEELLKQNSELIQHNKELIKQNNELQESIKKAGKSHIIRGFIIAVATGVVTWLITSNFDEIVNFFPTL